MARQRSGGCLCEAVRYEFSVDPVTTVHCYCRDCQKVTGSAFVTVLNEAVAWTNYSGTAVEIRFDKEAVKKLRCKEQSPFQMTEDDSVLSSGEVRASEVVTLCQFAPGEYEYTVRRKHSPSFPRGGTTTSTGKILVSQ